jgi:hypothetical protein
VVNNSQANAPGDEIIFSARYSPFRVWISVVVHLFPLGLILAIACVGVESGQYGMALLLWIIFMVLILEFLDSLFLKEIRFYRDRVAKLWHLFGSRTIFYSKAQVTGPPDFYRHLSSLHSIREIRDNGKASLLQVPIVYISFFFSSDTAKRMGQIIDCLTEDTESNPRMVRKLTLTKEDIGHQA